MRRKYKVPTRPGMPMKKGVWFECDNWTCRAKAVLQVVTTEKNPSSCQQKVRDYCPYHAALSINSVLLHPREGREHTWYVIPIADKTNEH